MQWIHVTALAVFLAPYVGFVVRQCLYANFIVKNPESTIPVWEALFRYIWNGGVSWQEGFSMNFLSFGCFLFGLGYNMLYGVLLWKTKSLKLQQEASGLPALFSLSGGWGNARRIACWLF